MTWVAVVKQGKGIRLQLPLSRPIFVEQGEAESQHAGNDLSEWDAEQCRQTLENSVFCAERTECKLLLLHKEKNKITEINCL